MLAIMSDSKTNYSFEFPDDLRTQIQADAVKNGRTLADHIRFLLRESIQTK